MKKSEKIFEKNFEKISDTLLWLVPLPFFIVNIKGSKKYKKYIQVGKNKKRYIYFKRVKDIEKKKVYL